MKKVSKQQKKYDLLPQWIKDYMLGIHHHDEKGKIIYHESDMVKLIYKILKQS